MTDSTMTAMMNTTTDHQTSGSQHGDQHQISHSALTSLIDTMGATHVAINSGSWFSTSTWKDGKIPANGARVLISEGTTVIYDRESDARINTVAIQGRLKFVENSNTKLVVETMLNGPTGTLDIGTSANNFIAADKTAKIIFTSDRAISDLKDWDPTQLGKGLVSHGQVNVFGAEKAESIALVGDAIAGDNVLVLKQLPAGWRIGDTIVLGGTAHNLNGSHDDNSYFQDEVLKITAITGNKVSFQNQDITAIDNTVLRYSHVRPNVPEKESLKLYVANTTRNVSFSTEGGKSVPIQNRAHTMFMHNPSVQIQNAGFYDLGRSDKSKVVDDVGQNVDGSVGNGTNPRGRYALHFHRNGADNPTSTAAIAKGNAVVGSPGWGIVTHDSHANVQENVVFDVVGAGIAAESGNEIGIWEDNIVIKTTGFDHATAVQQKKASEARFDFGSDGEAYWVQGASQVQMQNNIAISSKVGITLFGDSLKESLFKEKQTIPISSLPANLQKLFPPGQMEVDLNDVPLRELSGFESYNAGTGMLFWGHLSDQDGHGEFSGSGGLETRGAHEGRSLVSDFKIWGARNVGISTLYSSSLDFENGLVVSNNIDRPSASYGVTQNVGTVDVSYKNITVDGFIQGMRIEYPVIAYDREDAASTIEGSTFRNNRYNLNKVGNRPEVSSDFSAWMRLENNVFETHANSQVPVARFTHKAIGGLAVELDAEASFDTDSMLAEEGGVLYPLASRGIAAYGWDLDANGTIDQFGRKISHFFDQVGNQEVNLTVWDNQGESTTLRKSINVQPTPYANAFLDGTFSGGQATLGTERSSKSAGSGWYNVLGQLSNGTLQLSGSPFGAFVGQIVHDGKIRRGEQTLKFSLKNIEGTQNQPKANNEVLVRLWGVDGQFNNDAARRTGPTQIGTLPMDRMLLTSQTFGGESADFFNWKDFSYDIDLSNGFEYLFIEVSAKNGNDLGDSIAIDNVSLTGDGLSAINLITSSEEPKEALLTEIESQAVASLSFDEASGNIAADSSTQGQTNDGQLRGSTDWIPRSGGHAVSFSGGSDVVRLRNSQDINKGIHSERTVSLQFKLSDEAKSGDKQVIYEEGGTVRGLNVYVDQDRLYVGGWNTPNSESGWKGTWLSTDSLLYNQWQHVALVLDGENQLTDDAFHAYLNGQLFGSGKGSQLWGHGDGIGVGNTNGRTRFHNGIATESSYGLTGAVDNLNIFNTALSASEVQSLGTSFM